MGWRETREEAQRSSRFEKLDIERTAQRNGLARLSEEKAQGRLYHHIPVFKGWLQRRWKFLSFTRIPMEKTKDNGYKTLLWRLQLDTGVKRFTIRKISYWNNLPKEVVDSPMLDNFKIQLDRVLGHLVYMF